MLPHHQELWMQKATHQCSSARAGPFCQCWFVESSLGLWPPPLCSCRKGCCPRWLGWETCTSVNRASPFLPPCQSHVFRKPTCNLSILPAGVTPGALWGAGREVFSPCRCASQLGSVEEQGRFSSQRAAIDASPGHWDLCAAAWWHCPTKGVTEPSENLTKPWPGIAAQSHLWFPPSLCGHLFYFIKVPISFSC